MDVRANDLGGLANADGLYEVSAFERTRFSALEVEALTLESHEPFATYGPSWEDLTTLGAHWGVANLFSLMQQLGALPEKV